MQICYLFIYLFTYLPPKNKNTIPHFQSLIFKKCMIKIEKKDNMIILKAKYLNKIQIKITLKLTNLKTLNTTIIFFI